MKRRSSGKRSWYVVVLVIVVLFGAIYLLISGQETAQGPSAPEPAEPRAVSLESRILFMGNTFWGRYINDWSMASDLGYAYPFSRLNEFNREQYDAWISGLECPTVAGLNLSSYAQEETLSFNCPPEYLPEAAKWFTAFTLANNHTDNQGADGFAETKTQLAANGIQYFGHYDPEALDEICNVVIVPARILFDDNRREKIELPLVFCGYHGVFKVPSAESLAQITLYSEYFPVIAMPHMGAEYQAAPDDLKISAYRTMIDNGAEMVIGDHPHWIQNSEVYNGRLIVYSMGNFMFDQQFNGEVTRSALIDIKLSGDAESAQRWAAVAEQCRVGLSECLEIARQNQLPKLQLTYEFDVLGSDDSGHITKPATPEELESIKQRLNWQTTAQGL
jgi:poly-gamma-glutamate synthesis protein (capsule biosynthesis protein)